MKHFLFHNVSFIIYYFNFKIFKLFQKTELKKKLNYVLIIIEQLMKIRIKRKKSQKKTYTIIISWLISFIENKIRVRIIGLPKLSV